MFCYKYICVDLKQFISARSSRAVFSYLIQNLCLFFLFFFFFSPCPTENVTSLTEVKMIGRFENSILDDCHCFMFLKRFDCIVNLQFIHYRRQEFTTIVMH